MHVRDLLKAKGNDVITIKADVAIPVAMATLIEHRISCLPVIGENSELIGILSDKDIFRFIHEEPTLFHQRTVGSIMTTEVIVGIEDDRLDYVAALMTKNRVRHIPVVSGKSLVGLISIGDIVKSQMQDIEIENRYLRMYIDGDYPG